MNSSEKGTLPRVSSNPAAVDHSGQRAVQIERDAIGNVLITGDGNVLVIQQETREFIEKPRESTPLGPNPYKGLAFFDEQDADRFFGREALIHRLWERLRELQSPPPNEPPPTRLLPVLGPSGSGKSSLVRAGLIPELARRPLSGWSRVQVAVFTPGTHPNEALVGVLARLATRDQAPVAKTREFQEELLHSEDAYDGLRRIADALPESTLAPLVLVVDQFEEIYTQRPENQREQEAFSVRRDAFIGNLLHAAAEPRGKVTVVLTLRSDFLGATMPHPTLNRLIAGQGEIVPVMSQDELRQAITAPAMQAGHPFDEATVDLLVAQSEGREGALPLLQFALTQIWEGLAKGVEPAETLREIGGVGGALAKRAQQLYDNLGSDTNKQIARRAFLALVSLGEGARDTRRRASLSEIVAAGENPQQVHNVLAVFARPDERLLTLLGTIASDVQSEVRAEIAHEALFEHWQQLRTWLDENREDIRFHRRLAEAARHWEEHQRPEGLLWQPPDLDLLRTFKDRSAQDMTVVEMDFYKASEQQQRRIQRRKRVTAGVLIVLTLFAVGFGLFAEHQRQQAEQQKAEAKTARQEAIHELANTYRIQGRNQRDDKNNPLKAAHYFMRAASLLKDDLPASRNAQLAGSFLIGNEVFLTRVSTQKAEVQGAVFSNDGRMLTWSEDGTARVWDAATGEALTPLLKHDKQVWGAMFSADERRVITWSADGTARVWDAATGKALTPPVTPPGKIKGAESSSSEKRVLNTNKSMSVPSADGRRELVWSRDGKARIRDTATGKPLTPPLVHKTGIVGAVFSGDSNRLLTWSQDGKAQVWNAATGETLTPPLVHKAWVSGAVFSYDNSRLLTWSQDGKAQVWNAATGETLTPPLVHKAWVSGAVFSYDNSRVLIWSEDNTARVWSAATGEALTPPMIHQGGIREAMFIEDETLVLTRNWNDTKRVWDIGIKNDWPRKQLILLVEVQTGTRLTDLGELEALSAEEWQSKKRQYEEIRRQLGR